MKWKPLDYMLVSQCVQIAQSAVNSGTIKASDLLAKVAYDNEELAKEMFEAWRIRFLDRIENEIEDTMEHYLQDINYDLEYYKKGTGE